MRGSSGARIIIHDDYVEKLDTERTGTRVREQGIWLRRHGTADTFPHVTQVLADGYAMEVLEERELPRTQDDVDDLCHLIMTHLRSDLWDDKVVYHGTYQTSSHVAFSMFKHKRYVKQLLNQTDMKFLRSQLFEFTRRIDWHTLAGARTHGDPIIDNVLYRPGKYSPVLVDPIPACSAIPDLEVVDVGRLIQSAARYEAARYGELVHDALVFRNSVEEILNTYMPDDFRVNDARAALHFAVIHTLRGVRSAPKERKNALKSLVMMITTEAQRWMR